MLKRQDMLDEIQARGWRAKLYFGRDWPFFVVSGNFPAYVEVPIPVWVTADHSEALDILYGIVGKLLAVDNTQTH